MPRYRYRALNGDGELVSGAVVAASPREVADRIDQMQLVLVDNPSVEEASGGGAWSGLFRQPRPEDVTVFTRDLALLLRAGARINDALELLAADRDIGRLRGVVTDIRSRVLAGESFAEALERYPSLFPLTYLALIRVGEAAGSLDSVLQSLTEERMRAEEMKRKLNEAMRYPLFVLGAAGCVLTFFLLFVLPQFAGVLQDFGAKADPMVATFLSLSNFLRDNSSTLLAILLVCLVATWWGLRHPGFRQATRRFLTRPPVIRDLVQSYQTSLFCRNLGVLLGSGVNLTLTLRILVEMMGTTGSSDAWRHAAERVRNGAKLSDSLAETGALPAMATRMLRLGDETGQLPLLASRIAEFYEARLQRLIDRVVGIAGPAAIIVISIVVGGLIVSIMTALMSVSQMVG